MRILKPSWNVWLFAEPVVYEKTAGKIFNADILSTIYSWPRLIAVHLTGAIYADDHLKQHVHDNYMDVLQSLSNGGMYCWVHDV
jgi:uncharacterized YccA/Bax inhibitor family protein